MKKGCAAVVAEDDRPRQFNSLFGTDFVALILGSANIKFWVIRNTGCRV